MNTIILVRSENRCSKCQCIWEVEHIETTEEVMLLRRGAACPKCRAQASSTKEKEALDVTGVLVVWDEVLA